MSLTRAEAVDTLSQWMPLEEAEVLCDWWLEFGPPFAPFETPRGTPWFEPWFEPWFRWHFHRLVTLAREATCLAVLNDPLVISVFQALDALPPDHAVVSDLQASCFHRRWLLRPPDPVFYVLERLCATAIAPQAHWFPMIATRWAEWEGAVTADRTRYLIEWAALNALYAYQLFLSPGGPPCPSSPTRPSPRPRRRG